MADVIRHLMQVAHEWADEPNDVEHGRSDTLEMELRGALGAIVNSEQIYTLIVRMFRQPDELLRSMMAQDLCRLLRVGMHARTKEERQAHFVAAGKAIERDVEGGFLPGNAGVPPSDGSQQ